MIRGEWLELRSGKHVVGVHAFIWDNSLCWMSNVARDYWDYKTLVTDETKNRLEFGDCIVYISKTTQLEGVEDGRIIEAIIRARRDNNFKSIRLD